MLDIGLAARKDSWDLSLAGDHRPQAVGEGGKIAMNEIEHRRRRGLGIYVGIPPPVPDRFNIKQPTFDAIDSDCGMDFP